MKAIIFDFDGVLHDTFELGYKINAEIFGTNFTKGEYRDFFNGNIRSHKKVTRSAVDAFFIHQNKAFESLEVKNEVRIFLESVYTQFSLFIISSNQEIALNMYIENNELTHIFREVFGIETHKSKIEKFKYLFEKYNLQADNCVFITDTLGDIKEIKLE